MFAYDNLVQWFKDGVGVTNFEGEPYCSLLSFDSRKERDAWVAADHFDNNWHRSAMSRREALPLMRAELADLFDGYDGWRVDGVFYASIGDAFAAFFKAEAAALRRAGV